MKWKYVLWHHRDGVTMPNHTKEFKTFNTITVHAPIEVNTITKGKPKLDGSGKGTRNNRGRGGCIGVRKTGKMSRRR